MKIKQLKEFINQLPDEADAFAVKFRNIDTWEGDSWQGFEILLESVFLDEDRKSFVLMDLVSTQSHSEKMKQVSMEELDKDQTERDRGKDEAD